MLSIHAAIEEYLGAKQNSVTRKTYQWYTEFLDLFERYCNEQEHPINMVGQVTPQVVQGFVSACPPQSSPHTRHARAQIVKGWLRWCSLDEELGVRSKMVDRIEMPKLIQSDIELFTPEDIARLMRACDRLPHPHRFRHTFAVNQLLAGTSDLVLMRLMGHSSLESTKIYTRAMSGVQARRTAPSVTDIMKSGHVERMTGNRHRNKNV